VKIRFLADANFNRKIISGVLRREPRISFLSGAEVDLTGIPDLQVLALAASEGRLLLSHDVHTMPRAFAEFTITGSSGGLLLISQSMPIGSVINGLLRIWEESTAEEWKNRIAWIPL
jgi:hypothetical protein